MDRSAQQTIEAIAEAMRAAGGWGMELDVRAMGMGYRVRFWMPGPESAEPCMELAEDAGWHARCLAHYGRPDALEPSGLQVVVEIPLGEAEMLGLPRPPSQESLDPPGG